MTYFHTGTRTIIGATSFHGPVRNGKGWVRSAMAAKHKRWELEKRSQTPASDTEWAVWGNELAMFSHIKPLTFHLTLSAIEVVIIVKAIGRLVSICCDE